ncbi:DNA-binding transcriptional regulator OxyR [Corallincola luteus]|uniref:DNA-binding transcriptional regulator OxyR n=1 Tax=Corallincola luteus TaxID=1775177 RepID=A0ABY2AR59_9GAMM|nr:DNA-binding transcriptional regulator OxyR [Corallincola luteus]TCI04512.1 DNA-binding transcriptional regulator OxyR [Corallincola luteus]
MNIRDFQYLIALHDTGHFGRAAASCYVSQPTLSGQLSKLEDELGLQLVERSRRSMMFTPAGEAIVAQARQVLLAVDEVKHEAERWRDPMATTLRLGLIPTVAPYLLPHLLPAVQREFPALRVELHELQTEVLLEQLGQGKLDALILAKLPGMEKYDDRLLYQEPMLLAAASDHPLLLQPSLQLAQLQGESVLMLEDGHCLRDQALGVCFAAGAEEDPSFRATSLETLRHMVALGRGITLMPLLACSETGKSHGLCYANFSAPQPTRDIVMLWRKGSGISRTCTPLSDLCSEVVKEAMRGYIHSAG